MDEKHEKSKQEKGKQHQRDLKRISKIIQAMKNSHEGQENISKKTTMAK